MQGKNVLHKRYGKIKDKTVGFHEIGRAFV